MKFINYILLGYQFDVRILLVRFFFINLFINDLLDCLD